MGSKGFAALQVLATAALAGAVEQLSAHNYWVALGLGVLGILGYVVYELVPENK